MPRVRRSNIGRRSRRTNAVRLHRQSPSEEQRLQINAQQRMRNRSANSQQPRNQHARVSIRVVQQMENAAFNYDSTFDYCKHANIGHMNLQCVHCKALKF